MENSNKFKGYLDMYIKIINHRAWRFFLALVVLVVGISQDAIAGPEAIINRSVTSVGTAGNAITQISIPGPDGNLTLVDKDEGSCNVKSTKLAGGGCCINEKESPAKTCAPVTTNKQCPTDYLSDSSDLCGDNCAKLKDPAYILAEVSDSQNRPDNFDFYMSPSRSCASLGGALIAPHSCKIPCRIKETVELLANTSIRQPITNIRQWDTWQGCESGDLASGQCFAKCPAILGKEQKVTAKFVDHSCPKEPFLIHEFGAFNGDDCCGGAKYCDISGMCQTAKCDENSLPPYTDPPSYPGNTNPNTSFTCYCRAKTSASGTTCVNQYGACNSTTQVNCDPSNAACWGTGSNPTPTCKGLGEIGPGCCQGLDYCEASHICSSNCNTPTCAGDGQIWSTLVSCCDPSMKCISTHTCTSNCPGGGGGGGGGGGACIANGSSAIGICCSRNNRCNGVCVATPTCPVQNYSCKNRPGSSLACWVYPDQASCQDRSVSQYCIWSL